LATHQYTVEQVWTVDGSGDVWEAFRFPDDRWWTYGKDSNYRLVVTRMEHPNSTNFTMRVFDTYEQAREAAITQVSHALAQVDEEWNQREQGKQRYRESLQAQLAKLLDKR
jgi:hypothetical protein